MSKVALVTGASRGIGRTICLTLAKKGYSIIGTYNNSKDKAITLEEELKKLNTDCLILKCDISNELEVKQLVTDSLKKFGKIDCLCNNAGIAIDSLFRDKTVENFKKTLNVNLIGTFLVSKYVGEEMVRNGRGKIVNISSTNGINTYFPMCLDYDASKAGINSLTHNLAMQFAPCVNVNAIAPGFIKTQSETELMDEEYIKNEEEKIFLRRGGTEQDVANLVAFLFSEEADFINNAIIRIDGGTYGSF